MTPPADRNPARAWLSGETPGVDHLSCGELPCPTPADGELLVRVEAAALNFSDLLMIDDAYQVRPPRPFVPGQEIAGTVVEAGASASTPVGTRVAGKVLWGGFSDRALMRDDMAICLPDNIGATEGVALPVSYTTALVALTECTQVGEGETLLVHAAAGAVGLAAVQVGAALGARVIATTGAPDKCGVARQNGAVAAVNYRDENWAEQVRGAADGGVDVIFDPVGGDIAKASLDLLAYRGRHLVVGFASGDVPRFPGHKLLLNRLSAIGVYWNHDTDAEMLRRVTARMIGMCGAGALHPVIGGTYPFADLPRALADLRDRGSVGKLVLEAADG